jgi:hypothetical protein
MIVLINETLRSHRYDVRLYITIRAGAIYKLKPTGHNSSTCHLHFHKSVVNALLITPSMCSLRPSSLLSLLPPAQLFPRS